MKKMDSKNKKKKGWKNFATVSAVTLTLGSQLANVPSVFAESTQTASTQTASTEQTTSSTQTVSTEQTASSAQTASTEQTINSTQTPPASDSRSLSLIRHDLATHNLLE
ncbi:hypothetical protein [Enterococcus lactis]|uniref:hypothetical protein n=1 Tax=Enterococcus lactis TaxID=357441 RepID=UPI0040416A0B